LVAKANNKRSGEAVMRLALFSDGAAGNLKQVTALAHGLGFAHANTYTVTLRGLAHYLAPTLRRERFETLQINPALTSDPQIAIGCGRAGAVALDALKRRHPSVRTIQILDPRCTVSRFDWVICPAHDRLRGPNVINVVGALHEIDDAWLHAGQCVSAVPAARTLVLLGAPTRHAPFDADVLDRLATLDAQGLCISASRRTPSGLLARARALGATFWSPHSFSENPYQRWLSTAQEIYVTADSVNMLSEACATRAKVHVLGAATARGKLARLLASLAPRLAQRDEITPFRDCQRGYSQLKNALGLA
jgi:uncharacterized protein